MQRHTVEQIVDLAPIVQILDAPVPQVAAQLVDVLTLFDISVPKQVIEVPKILSPSRPLRVVLAATQMAEQLVEVPTVVSPSFFSQLAEQIVDTPVPSARGSSGNGGVQGFLPEQSFAEQNVDIPVPGARSRFPGEGLQIFRSGQGSAASPAVQAGRAVSRGVSYFFCEKKVHIVAGR